MLEPLLLLSASLVVVEEGQARGFPKAAQGVFDIIACEVVARTLPENRIPFSAVEFQPAGATNPVEADGDENVDHFIGDQ